MINISVEEVTINLYIIFKHKGNWLHRETVVSTNSWHINKLKTLQYICLNVFSYLKFS
jgi:hypothetical protein